VLIQPLDLRGEHPSQGERRQVAYRKELHRVGLAARPGAAAEELAEEEQLVDVMYPRGMRVAVLVDERGYATPKVDVRGGVFREDQVLLVRERATSSVQRPSARSRTSSTWSSRNTPPRTSTFGVA